MHVEERVEIAADPGRVWEIMTDVERWPEWTPSVRRVALLAPGPLAEGVEARVEQPRFGTRTWRVTALDPGRSFTWESRAPGTHMVATHAVEPRAGGGAVVTLGVRSSGWAVTLLGWLLAGTGRRFVAAEAAGLKAASEGHPPGDRS